MNTLENVRSVTRQDLQTTSHLERAERKLRLSVLHIGFPHPFPHPSVFQVLVHLHQLQPFTRIGIQQLPEQLLGPAAQRLEVSWNLQWSSFTIINYSIQVKSVKFLTLNNSFSVPN